ncbi:MAG: hypothetical protein U0175_15345 [Caldilineaceae bacterium]
MLNSILDLFVTDGLWVVVVAGWIFLLFLGLEADRPMSGGLPGHTVEHHGHKEHVEGTMGKLGEKGAWVVFGLTSLSLPLLLWWIFFVADK